MSAGWWCPKCQVEVSAESVSFCETHAIDGCGAVVLPMSDTEPDQCSTCRFHRPPVRGDTQGQCRRWPPLAHYRILVNTEPTRYEHAIDQPYVNDDGWCGEYQRAEVAA